MLMDGGRQAASQSKALVINHPVGYFPVRRREDQTRPGQRQQAGEEEEEEGRGRFSNSEQESETDRLTERQTMGEPIICIIRPSSPAGMRPREGILANEQRERASPETKCLGDPVPLSYSRLLQVKNLRESRLLVY